MKKAFVLLTAMTLAVAVQAVEIGKPAPDFTATDINGKTIKLSDYKGKIVVLESYNSD
jgi:peroxiredoxin